MSKTYTEKLQDARWKKRAAQIKLLDNWRCRVCSGVDDLDVHHIYYDHGSDPWDYPDEALITQCHECHLQTEISIRETRKLLGQFHYYEWNRFISSFFICQDRVRSKQMTLDGVVQLLEDSNTVRQIYENDCLKGVSGRIARETP